MANKSEVITALEAEEAAARLALEAVSVRLWEAHVAALGVKIGDVVRSTSRRLPKGEELKITGFHNPSYGWLTAVRRKKDGTWSKAEVHLFSDWERIDG